MKEKEPSMKLDTKKVGHFRYKELKNNKYLLTNDLGEFIVLAKRDFDKFLKGELPESSYAYPILQEQGLIKSDASASDSIKLYRKRNACLWAGPTLHIIVTTLRCNQKCVYCQVSSHPESHKDLDLDKKTAEKTVDVILDSPSQFIAIEFQGGEPLLNWGVVRHIIEYANRKNKKIKKKLEFRLVSNFSLMDKEKLDYLSNNNINLCTSLDGPEKLHNQNRIWLKGNSYDSAKKWLAISKKLYEDRYRPAALTTISRMSLKYPKEIVDEYVKLKMDGIFLRPLSHLGFAKNIWDKIGYTAEEFIDFYIKALNYIIDCNLKKPGFSFHENYAKILLTKILTDRDPGYTDLRSPCGAAIGQLLYNYNGEVYTCDEGRMLGDKVFCLGDVNKDKYTDIILHPTVRKVCLASCLDGLYCDMCVYKPYCGVCPVCNYAETGNVFNGYNNDKCKINMAIFDFLFEKLQNKSIRAVFEKWVYDRKVK